MLLRLLKAGTNPNCADGHLRTPLHLAASRTYVEIVTLLLEYGADPNQKDLLGNTPLHLAVCSASSNNCNMVVRTLVQYGASVHSTDRMGKNPLDLAKSKLSLMRSRRLHLSYMVPNFEEDRRFIAMTCLTNNLMNVYTREQRTLDDINLLENGFQNLTTNEIDTEADNLLAKIDQLGIGQ